MDLAKPNVNHICTLDNVPIHQIVLISEKVYQENEVKSTVQTFISTGK